MERRAPRPRQSRTTHISTVLGLAPPPPTLRYEGGGGAPPSSSVGGRSPRPSTTAGVSATASWRLHKKFFFESLQKDIADLQRGNAALKSIMHSRLHPEDTTVLLEGCDANNRRRRRWRFAPPLPP
jgi:hypothetical protein